jgi:hypothetical protein
MEAAADDRPKTTVLYEAETTNISKIIIRKFGIPAE